MNMMRPMGGKTYGVAFPFVIIEWDPYIDGACTDFTGVSNKRGGGKMTYDGIVDALIGIGATTSNVEMFFGWSAEDECPSIDVISAWDGYKKYEWFGKEGEPVSSARSERGYNNFNGDYIHAGWTPQRAMEINASKWVCFGVETKIFAIGKVKT